MRLLRWRVDGGRGYSLIECYGSDIPPYAILSHTWGQDDEEVTFRDIMEGTWEKRSGREKLDFCINQALEDELEHCWIDTCCIDKSSSAELSEAINSMFSYYQNATRCYVYLADVSETPSSGHMSVSLSMSRWFTRGWTLQELLAPETVWFFNNRGERIGDKKELAFILTGITKIPPTALSGTNMSQFSVEERLSWAANRQTKREEDEIYSLLGIFDVYMPLIYGEGKKRALLRLRKHIKESLEDSFEDQDWKSSIPGNVEGTGTLLELLPERKPKKKNDNPNVTTLSVVKMPDGGDTFIFYLAKYGAISYLKRARDGKSCTAHRVVAKDTQKVVKSKDPSLAAAVYRGAGGAGEYHIRLFYINLSGHINGLYFHSIDHNIWKPSSQLNEQKWTISPGSGLSALGSPQIGRGNIEIFFRDQENKHKLTRGRRIPGGTGWVKEGLELT